MIIAILDAEKIATSPVIENTADVIDKNNAANSGSIQ
jgi:hypothetical protein